MRRRNFFSVILFISYILTIGVIGFYFYSHSDYYLSLLTDRIHHPDYKILKPGGSLGHAFGILGTFMMILLLLYSIRKRTRLFKDFGMMSSWLKIHIFLGISGPLFVILHSTFKLNGLVAVSFWSMLVVALSGILGRYLYLQIPRNISGYELSREEAENNYHSLSNKIKSEGGLDESQIQQWESFLTKSHVKSTPILRFLYSISIINIFRDQKLKAILNKEFSLSQEQIKKMLQLSQEMLRLNNKIQFWDSIHRLFHYWHVFHKPFAIIMYLIMLVHVGISIWLGYTYF